MSNRLTIQPTEFHDFPNGDVTYGVRVYDDYAQTYDNSWEDMSIDDLAIIAKVLEEFNDDVTKAMLNHVQEHQKGLAVGDTWYEWDEIKHLWELSQNV